MNWKTAGWFAIVASALVCGCSVKRYWPDPEILPVANHYEDPNGNIVLYISNQSFAITPVDIRIEIDKKPVVHTYFHVGNQHNWTTYKLHLKPGKHQLDVYSEKGDTSLSKAFEVLGKHWVVVDYWYYPESHYNPTPRRFSFSIQDEPIYFM